ncbi:MAG: nucleoside triphosphate pyrophosphatase [Oligoflexales bacterium]
MDLNAYKFFLASTSPRRRELLGSLNLSFTLKSPGFEERLEENEKANDYVRRNGEGKSKWVASEICSSSSEDPSEKRLVVLGADTVVVLEDEILQKPKSASEAIAMLSQLSGRTHQVLTGFAFSYQKQAQGDFFLISDVVVTEVTFKGLSQEEIQSYVATGEPMDKAGSYGIQGKAAYFVQKISGSYTNVMGLPLTEIYDQLNSLP